MWIPFFEHPLQIAMFQAPPFQPTIIGYHWIMPQKSAKYNKLSSTRIVTKCQTKENIQGHPGSTVTLHLGTLQNRLFRCPPKNQPASFPSNQLQMKVRCQGLSAKPTHGDFKLSWATKIPEANLTHSFQKKIADRKLKISILPLWVLMHWGPYDKHIWVVHDDIRLSNNPTIWHIQIVCGAWRAFSIKTKDVLLPWMPEKAPGELSEIWTPDEKVVASGWKEVIATPSRN